MMKNFFIALVATICAVSVNAEPQGSREILLDNAQVQVIRLKYPAGSESGMHSHEFPVRTVYVLSGGDMEIVNEDGSKSRLSPVTGSVFFMPAATHNIRNIGATTIELLEQELK